jgi:hypothetical protein
MHYTDVTGLLGCALAMVVVCTRLLGALQVQRKQLHWLLPALFIVLLVPAGGLPLAGYMRGVTGDLSIATLVLLASALWGSLRGVPAPPGRSQLLLLILIAAAGFYPLALGWGDYDPYRLGYGSPWLLVYLLSLSLLSVLRGLPLIALSLSLSVLAWSAGWYESTNLWDYLLDPMVSVYAAAALIAQVVRKFRAAQEIKP